MVPSGGETSGTSETSNTLHQSIKSYIINVFQMLTHRSTKRILAHRSTKRILESTASPDFLENKDFINDDNSIKAYLEFQLDSKFIGWVAEARDQILLGAAEKRSIIQDEKARDILFYKTKEKIMHMQAMKEFRTVEYYADNDNTLNAIITEFIEEVKHYR
ncbi:uncharacterized protein LOC126842590 isoform X2 [Adelges cooleyi]|nr:uncharacterized protein LOC126842590 isoform X2 [Adelges cooleyi]